MPATAPAFRQSGVGTHFTTSKIGAMVEPRLNCMASVPVSLTIGSMPLPGCSLS